MKKMFSVIIAAVLVFCPVLSAAAAQSTLASREPSYTYNASLDRVIDDADLLTDSEEAKLREKINSIIADYSFDVVILTVNSIGNKTPEQFADDYYDYNNYGYGADCDGMLFMLGMQTRDYYTSTTGKGIKVFTDYGIESISDEVVGYLSEGEYFTAFSKYLDLVREYLYKYNEDGIPYDSNEKYNDAPYNGGEEYTANPFKVSINQVGLYILIGFIIAFIIVGVMKKGMNTAVPNNFARVYVKPDSLHVTFSDDRFLFRTTTRVPVQQNNSSGGGSSTHVGSSGTSHGGGGGKF